MYKEQQQDTIEESSYAMNNQPSNGDSSIDLKGKSSTETNETEDKVGSADEDKMSVQSTQIEHKEAPAEDFSSLVGTVMSDTSIAMDSEQTAKEDIDELVQSSSDTISSDKAGFDEANYMNGGVLDGILEKAVEEESKDTCDKDNDTIDLLKKEVQICTVFFLAFFEHYMHLSFIHKYVHILFNEPRI